MSPDLEPLQLKAALVARGVRLDGSANGTPDDTVDLLLPSNVRVAAPIRATPGESGFRLVESDGRTFVAPDDPNGARVPVRAARPPRFYAAHTSSGRPMRDVGVVRGRALVVTPGGGCGYGVRGAPCAFCIEGGSEATHGPPAATPAEAMEVVRTARREGAIDVVLLNSAAFDLEDGGLSFLAPYVSAIRRHVDVIVAVQMHPPRDARFVRQTYALGVDAVSYNLELWDPDAGNRHCSGRARFIGRDRYLEMLTQATAIFPRGAVWSELVSGIEAPEATMAGIDAMARIGVVPVVSVARAAHGAPTAGPSRDDLAVVLPHLAGIVDAAALDAGWIRDLSLAITPLEARDVLGERRNMRLAWQGWLTHTRPGATVRRGLAGVRRRLRVQRIRPGGH
jgi:hypothetical protein